jgi:uncharacterized membrane protein YkgB
MLSMSNGHSLAEATKQRSSSWIPKSGTSTLEGAASLRGILKLGSLHVQTGRGRRFYGTNREWHHTNGTYPVSYGLGVVVVSIGILIAIYPIKPGLSALGSFLLIFMAFTTLSFLITTPEAWVPALGDANHGFPFLSGMGRLVIKDAIMLGAAFLTLTDAARESLRRRKLSA